MAEEQVMVMCVRVAFSPNLDESETKGWRRRRSGGPGEDAA